MTQVNILLYSDTTPLPFDTFEDVLEGDAVLLHKKICYFLKCFASECNVQQDDMFLFSSSQLHFCCNSIILQVLFVFLFLSVVRCFVASFCFPDSVTVIGNNGRHLKTTSVCASFVRHL